jgi:hypothetical protein
MTEVSTTLKLFDVRLDRVSLLKPYIGKDAEIDPATGKQKGKYHADLILSPEHPQLQKIKDLMRAAAFKKWKEEAPAILNVIAAQDKLCLHKGDITRAGKPQYAGKLYISANNDVQPNIVVTDGGVNLSTTEGTLSPAHPCFPYAGSHANVIIDIWAYAHVKGGKGISCTLTGVQFLRHDVRLAGSSIASTSEFGLVASEADSAAPAAAAEVDSLV